MLTLFLVTGLHSCTGLYHVVEFEVLEPANINFPDHIDQLIVLNRAPFSFENVSEDIRVNMEKEHLLMVDTLITNNLFRGMLDILEQSPFEKFQKPFWLSERRGDTAFARDMVLTKREVSSLCHKFGADAIISLESYFLDVKEHILGFPDAPGETMTHYFELSNRINWRIYLPENPKPFDHYTTVDTLYYSHILNGELQHSTPVTDMIRELFTESGMKYGRYLVPVWTYASRALFKRGGDSLKQAIRHTSRGEWDEAFLIWHGLSESQDSTLASKAYSNMAVYYELEDNLDSASLLVDLALKHDSLEAVMFYREELDTRLLNRKEIIKQIN